MTWSKAKRIRVMFDGCLHHPIVNRESLQWLYEQAEEFRPDIWVNLGDAMEGTGYSRHATNLQHTQEDEFESWRDDVAYRNGLSFIKRRIWMYGNHEANATEPERVNPKLKSLVNWRKWNPLDGTSLRDELEDWEIVDSYGSHVRRALGPFVPAHGTKIGINATRDEAAALPWLLPNLLSVNVHTHRALDVTRLVLAGGTVQDRWYANAGTHIEWTVTGYQTRNYFGGWANGCVCAETTVEDLRLKMRPDYFEAKEWDAETRIRLYAKDDPRLN